MGWVILFGIVTVYFLVVFRVIKLSNFWINALMYAAGIIFIITIASTLTGQNGADTCHDTRGSYAC